MLIVLQKKLRICLFIGTWWPGMFLVDLKMLLFPFLLFLVIEHCLFRVVWVESKEKGPLYQSQFILIQWLSADMIIRGNQNARSPARQTLFVWIHYLLKEFLFFKFRIFFKLIDQFALLLRISHAVEVFWGCFIQVLVYFASKNALKLQHFFH